MKGIIHGRKDNTLYGHMTVCNGLAFYKIIMSSYFYAALPNHRWKAGLKPPVSSIALRM